MEKFYTKTFRVVAILVMLSTAQLGVTYSNAESGENLELMETQKDPKITNQSQKERLGVILTEKVVNGKLEVRQFALPEDTTEKDMNRILSLEGTSGWSYVNYKAYHSGIVLFDGKVSKVGERYWKISVHGTLDLSKGALNLHLSGKSDYSPPEIKENSSIEDLDYRVIFSGKMEESDKENVFAIAFMNSTQIPETSQNIELLQFGTENSEYVYTTECNQLVRNPCLVI
jgi:hypothetical protein